MDIIQSMPSGSGVSKNRDESTPYVEPLLPRIASGDQRAVQEFVDRYGGLIWSLARRMSWNDSEAEDAVQEIFIDLWKSAPRYNPATASEVTFVSMIARRRLIDRRRKATRQPDLSTISDGVPSQSVDPADAASISQEAGSAMEALSQLSPEQQRVLRLSVLYGLSHDRIARATGLPLGTVKTHCRRGLIRLREFIESRGTTGGPSGVSS